MQHTKFIISIFFLIFLSCGDKKNDNEKDIDVKKENPGKEIYLERCIICHGMDGSMGMNGAKNLQESFLTKEEIAQIVAHGKGVMTPFKNLLSDQEIKEVSNYVISLRKK